MLKIPLLFVILLMAGFAKAQEYNMLLIPDSLRKGASVVKRSEEYILTIKSPAKFTLYETICKFLEKDVSNLKG